ncbi:hypothetical protein GE061_004864 [Apolygus lucorum]|uniref:Uncharacterized protein n=1 Tax=Apolygus lucorum TaxID=248454 RepID=A0A6A4IX39_APOLU|nr:hypothetical protein GE061_004864 [Apolygus lucorum]
MDVLDKDSVASHSTGFTASTVSKVKEEDSRTFINSYEAICKKSHTHPLREVKVASSSVKGTLDLIVDKVKFNDWKSLLKAVSCDRSLHSIAFKSRILQGAVDEEVVTDRQARDLKKGPVLFTVFMLQKFIDACLNCLVHSKTLRMYQLEKIPLTMDLVTSLAQGLTKTCCLQKLILVGCRLGDEGCFYITEAVKKIPSIRILDLSSNDLTPKGARHLANLIKFQDIMRYNECWKHSLRYREVNTEAIPGLRRFSINDNHEITDQGLEYIIEALYDDNWIKAIDMQNCGITDRGCSVVLKLLETNKEIVVFDIRKNDIINMTANASIISILGSHTKETDKIQFGWMDIDNPFSGSSEDSSSGGGSCSSYNLAYANEKVAKYVETTVSLSNNQLRAIQSAAALTSITEKTKRPQRQVKFSKPVERTASTARMKLTSSLSELILGAPKKTQPTPGYHIKTNAQKFATTMKIGNNNPQRQLSLTNVPNPAAMKSVLRPTRSVEDSCHDYPVEASLINEESNDVKVERWPDKVATSKTFIKEEVTKQMLERGRTHLKSSGSTMVEPHNTMDSNNHIELTLQQLFKTFGESPNDKSESKCSISRMMGIISGRQIEGLKKPNSYAAYISTGLRMGMRNKASCGSSWS